MEYETVNEEEIEELIQRENKTTKIIITTIIVVIAIIVLKNNIVFKDYEYVDDFSNLPDPIQKETNGGIIKTIDGTDFNIEYVAKYSISGLVVDVQKYYDFEYGKLSPVDVGMTWGFMVDESEKFHWYSKGTRYLHFETKETGWYRNVGFEEINKHLSNNHLIPCDEKIMKLSKHIKKGDYVKIEGYLVQSSWRDKNNLEYRWNSSTRRDDQGNGACEIIYVTSIKWLKEK